MLSCTHRLHNGCYSKADNSQSLFCLEVILLLFYMYSFNSSAFFNLVFELQAMTDLPVWRSSTYTKKYP